MMEKKAAAEAAGQLQEQHEAEKEKAEAEMHAARSLGCSKRALLQEFLGKA